MKVLICFGTRPEAIKMAPLSHAFRKEGIPQIICNTGQHLEMLEQVLHFFEIEPDYDLQLMTPNQSLNSLSSKILSEMEKVLEKELPDLVLVHGDTTTSLIAALASFHKGIPVAHVEAGLRTYNKRSPFPEEMNRQVTAKLSEIHFAPTEQAGKNLRDENIPADTIFVTGNTVVDALQFGKAKLEESKDEFFIQGLGKDLKKSKYILVTGHRRENLGAGLEQICEALLELSHSEDVEIIYPVHLNPKVKQQVYEKLGNVNKIHLIDPVSYPEMLWLMMNCMFVISDSGGIQEEAPGFGKCVLVTRNHSERMEGVVAGYSFLVGTDKRMIVSKAKELLKIPISLNSTQNPYGDGKASQRIAITLLDYWSKK